MHKNLSFWDIPNKKVELRIKFYLSEMFLVKTQLCMCLLLFSTHAPQPVPRSSHDTQLSPELYQAWCSRFRKILLFWDITREEDTKLHIKNYFLRRSYSKDASYP
jgi:hypothetical protein